MSRVRWHHEKYDGTGYPDRLLGDEFPVSAQVVEVVAPRRVRRLRPRLGQDAPAALDATPACPTRPPLAA